MALLSPDRIDMSPSPRQRLRCLIRAGTTGDSWCCGQVASPLVSAAGPGAAPLGDTTRSGRPPSFTPVQVAAVKALACQPPEARGVPLSRWTCPDLAVQVVAEGIAASVSTYAGWPRTRSNRGSTSVLDLHHRPGLRRQGRPGPGPVQPGMG